jgi:glycosyltransferase involved in cell wall biosynthesis
MDATKRPAFRRPRALLIIENCPFPADRRVWDEATALRDSGYEVSVVSPMGLGRCTSAYERVAGIDVYRFAVPSADGGMLSFVKEYCAALWATARLSLRLLIRPGYDVVQVCNPPDLFFVHGWVYKLLGKGFIYDQHDLAPEIFRVRFSDGRGKQRLVERIMALCEWITYKTADVVIVTNESFRKRALMRGGLTSERVFVVRNGPDAQRMQLVSPEPLLKAGRPLLACYVGQMGMQDGVELAVRAAHWVICEAGRTDVTFAFLGDGDQLAYLKRLAEQLEIADYLVFPGFVDSDLLMRYLCTADVGLIPDPQNGVNEHSTFIKVMEYMAAELPMVAFALTETRYSAQEAAVYATPNDHAEFGQLITQLLEDPARRTLLGQMGRRRVEEVLSWDHSRPHLLAAYAAALERHGRTAPDATEEPSCEWVQA